MCWRINKIRYKKHPEMYHKFAFTDMTVYKIGRRPLGDSQFFIPYFKGGYLYEAKKMSKKIKLKKEEDFSSFFIDEGYHCYSEDCFYHYNNHAIMIYNNNIKSFKSFAIKDVNNNNNDVGIFIIPKGSEYYENEDGEIVSSQLVWTGKSIKLKLLKRRKYLQFKDLEKYGINKFYAYCQKLFDLFF